MRIAYLCHLNEGTTSGVFRKIVTQASVWQDAGHDVRVFQVARESAAVDGTTTVAWKTYRYATGLMSRLLRWRRPAEDVGKWNPDVVYQRYELYSPWLARIARRYPMILEINSLDTVEQSLQPGLRRFYNSCTRNRMLSLAAGIVSVTQELTTHPTFCRHARACCVISNGIRLADFTVLPPSSSTVPRLVFIGSAKQPWHGIDKMIELASYRPEWQFDLIGVSSDEFPQLPPNATLYGPLRFEQYTRIMANACVGLGTLALHRKGMYEACPLKTREYLALGLPVITAYRDTDFPSPVPFILQLPANESAIATSLERIDQFVADWRERRVDRASVAHLDWESKEATRLSFFAEICRQRNRGRHPE